MWALWDSFGIEGSDMVGWWQPEAPVRIVAANGSAKVKYTFVDPKFAS
jgi:hypothetical protein